MKCQCENCGGETDKLYLHSRCHIESPTWAILDQKNQEVEIICSECKAPIVKFKVLQILS